MPAERYMANPDVSCRQETTGAALFNPDSDDSLAVNAVGHLIWLALARPSTQPEIVTHLLATCHGAPAAGVAGDVADFLESLLPRGLVGMVLPGDGPLPAIMAPGPMAAPAGPAGDASPARDRFYHGNSMAGTFRHGDALVIEAVPLAAVRSGDVVIFRATDPAGKVTDVVHRVVSVTAGGLVTRGDNNARVDSNLVGAEALLGRVTHRVRGGRPRRVRGGQVGLRLVRARRAGRRLRRRAGQVLRAMGRPAYRRLRATGVARRLWRPAITRLVVATPRGPLLKYVHGRQVVARWQPDTGHWSCRQPYDLILDWPGNRTSPVSSGALERDEWITGSTI